MCTEIVTLLAELESDNLVHRVDQAPPESREQAEQITRRKVTTGEVSSEAVKLFVSGDGKAKL